MKKFIDKNRWELNDISAVFFFLIAALITIMIYIYALDVEYVSYYSRRVEPLTNMELKFLKEYRIYKQTPELVTFDSNNQITRQRATKILERLSNLRQEKALVAARMDFRGKMLFTGLLSFFCLLVLSYIVVRNQNRVK